MDDGKVRRTGVSIRNSHLFDMYKYLAVDPRSSCYVSNEVSALHTPFSQAPRFCPRHSIVEKAFESPLERAQNIS